MRWHDIALKNKKRTLREKIYLNYLDQKHITCYKNKNKYFLKYKIKTFEFE